MARLITKLAVVFGAQGVLAWLFYRSRAVSHLSWTDSDFAVFGLPLVIGFAVAALIVFMSFPQSPPSKRLTATFGLPAVGAVISSYIGTVIAFNLYGT
ncbi:MAG TPA: hypothetical protein VK850_18665 [Candidatus Binatia bacterium]|nr:hypothetical protein [Candidatus Binatia bacterium]